MEQKYTAYQISEPVNAEIVDLLVDDEAGAYSELDGLHVDDVVIVENIYPMPRD